MSHGFRLRGSDLTRLLVAWLGATLALWAAAALLPGLHADPAWTWATVAAVAGVVGLVLRPVLIEVSARIGWAAVLLVALVGQAAVLAVAIGLVPGVESDFGTAVVASWITAGVGTLISWLTTAGTDDGFIASIRGRGNKVTPVVDPEVDGVVFVQLDGVAFPVLRWAVQAGGVPTIRQWLASGSHHLREWTPQLPCTTPASQLGLLHGTVDRVPAFRWYDRELGRVLVANRPRDARIIEDRAADGSGLLADDGVSISNLFSGDAARSLLTMSRAEAKRGSAQTRRTFAWFLATPGGFSRSLSRTLAEVVKERWQAKRQVRRNLDPRVHRGWTFAALRAVTNAMLRDLNTALVAEEMHRGTKAIYVDYVDYDEIAHHAGMFRPESLAALEGLDRVLHVLTTVAERAPRRYRIVVLSDHGQSQGRSFADRYGQDLPSLCEQLTATGVQAVQVPVEGWGRADALVEDVGGKGLTGILSERAAQHIDKETAVADEQPDLMVLGSGNLGLLYVPGPDRTSLNELGRRWPNLVRGLCTHPGIGFVAGIDDDGVPWALGADGRRNLATGVVDGVDPLLAFGAHAPRVLARAVRMPEAPDVYINSGIDPVTLDVSAFEELVGAHGGLGGYQDSAALLVPSDLAAGLPDRIEGADQLHVELVAMLETCGHRHQRSRIRDARTTSKVTPRG